MTVSVNVTAESSALVLAELQALFPALATGRADPMATTAIATTTAVEPKVSTRGSRKKAEDAKADAGEQTGTTMESPTVSPGTTESSTSGASETASSATDSATQSPTSSEVPDIEVVRAKLKQLGATEGLGHDKVFEVLGKYSAKNASTVPEARRAELVAEIDGLIAGVGK
jgi:hypothetical protein